MFTSFTASRWIVLAPAARLERAGAPARAWKPGFGAVLLLWCVGVATPARAQMTVSPSVGISGEGRPAVGAAVGMSLGALRPELELAWAHRGIDRRAATPSRPFET